MFIKILNQSPNGLLWKEMDLADAKGDNIDTYDLLKDDSDGTDKKDENIIDQEKLDLEDTDTDKDDKKDDKKKSKDDKDDKDDKKEEEIEIDEEDDKSKEELVTPPRRAEILKAYPDIFKKFPQLEHAIYREHKFSEMFGTIDSAEEVAEKAKDYDEFSESLLKGDMTNVLKSVHATDENAFADIVDNYLPTLQKVNADAYHHVLGDVIRKTIISAVNSAKADNNEALLNAAAEIHQFIFGNKNLIKPFKFSKNPGADNPEVTKEKDEIKAQRAELIQEKYDGVKSDLEGKVDNILKNTIDANIDPKSLMSPYTRKNAVNDAMEMLDKLIEGDTRFVSIVDKLWEKAFNDNFSKDSLDKIRSAFLSKSKSLLPDVIKKIRAEALNDSRKLDNSSKDETKNNRNRDVSDRREERATTRSNNNNNDKSKDGRGMRTVDFFNS